MASLIRDQWLDDVPVYAADSIDPGAEMQGPALIQRPLTTAVLADGDIASVQMAGDILARVAPLPSCSF